MGNSIYLYPTVKTPVIEDGCRLKTNTSSGLNSAFGVYVYASLDNTNWVSIASKQDVMDLSFDIDLHAYLGAEIYLRLLYINRSGSARSASVSMFLIEK